MRPARTRETSPASPAAISAIVDAMRDDETTEVDNVVNVATVAPSENAADAGPTPEQLKHRALIEKIILHAGSSGFNSTDAWSRMLSIDHSLLLNAVRERKLEEFCHSRSGWGVRAEELLAFLKKNELLDRCQVSRIADCMFNGRPDEVFHSEQTYDLKRIAQKTGLPDAELQTAFPHNQHYITGPRVIDWLNNRSAPIVWPFDTANVIAHGRFIDGLNTQSADAPSSLAERIAARFEERDSARRAEREKAHRNQLAAYYEILHRRHEHTEADLQQLEELAEELGFHQSRVQADIALLDRIAAHEATIAEAADNDPTAELGTLETLADMHRRHEQEKRDLHQKIGHAYHRQNLVQTARREVAELRRTRPELFLETATT